MLNEKYIAIRIEELCRKRHLSGYALARIAGISESSISNIMSRGSLPSFFTLDRICGGFGITLAQFFSEDDKRPDLTEEQRHVLDVWDSLSQREKEAVTIYVKGIKLE